MSQKILFIDRDGTLIFEPQDNKQVDSLAKLSFLPFVIQTLSRIVRELSFQLVIVTNQDGLGTPSFPEEDFIPPHQKMLDIFTNEGITFKEVLIDKSFEKENLPTRKPRTGLLTHYLNGQYDLKNSFVIGDRLTDIQLAKNIGSQGILINSTLTLPKELIDTCSLQTDNWRDIFTFLTKKDRVISLSRKTKETEIDIKLNLDGQSQYSINTGLNFFNHMLEQLAKHSKIDISLNVKGDLEIDEHHTIEDTAIALGNAFEQALQTKMGIERYGFALPMDDSFATVALDLGGRPWLVWDVEFKREKIGDVPTEMFFHFFKSLADNMKANIFIRCEGDNEHHKIESIFKAFAKSLYCAIQKKPFDYSLPTTKGIL